MNYRLKRILTPALIIVAIMVLLWAVNIVATVHHKRVDFTRDQRHTLAPGSRNIIGNITSPVTISFYFSRSEKNVPQPIKDYVRRVDDLLREFEIAGNGKIELQRIDAKPESRVEESIQMVGIEARYLADGEHYFYLGIEVACVDRAVTLGNLDPAKERTLEYDVARAVMRVANPSKKVIGIITGLPVLGAGKGNPFNVRMSSRPWMFVQELRKDYEIRDIQMDAKTLPDNLDTLIVLHPREIPASTVFLIDQYLMRGGRLVALLDPLCAVDAKSRSFSTGKEKQFDSSLPQLLKAWGVTFDTSKIVVDPTYSVERKQDTQPAFLELDSKAMGRNDIISSSLSSLMLPYAGAFLCDLNGLEKTVLLHSSATARLLTKRDVLETTDLAPLLDQQQGKIYEMAIKLSGRFKSAFPGGSPDADVKLGAEPLVESIRPATVVLIADTDFLEDRVWSQRYFNSYTQKETVRIRNDNNTFLQNAVDQLSGGDDLIAIRSRTELPEFTRIKQMWQEADEKLREEMLRWQREAEETEARLKSLAERRRNSQQYIESPEERREKEALKSKQIEIAEKITELRRQRRRSIDRLGVWLMWLNIGAAPFLIALFGIGVAFYRRMK